MENKINLEIRASEGGEDSKLLVVDMKNIYIKTAKNHNINWIIDIERYGFVSIWLSGPKVKEIFKNEVGVHRWTRVSPTEKRGRLHTSSITVAILEISDFKEVEIRPEEINIETTRGSGAA